MSITQFKSKLKIIVCHVLDVVFFNSENIKYLNFSGDRNQLDVFQVCRRII